MKQHISVYAVVDDADPQAVSRVIEAMSRTVAGWALDGFESGLSVTRYDDDDGEDVLTFTPDDDTSDEAG